MDKHACIPRELRIKLTGERVRQERHPEVSTPEGTGITTS